MRVPPVLMDSDRIIQLLGYWGTPIYGPPPHVHLFLDNAIGLEHPRNGHRRG